MEIDKQTLAYTAGLMDGEGSVCLTRHRKNEFRSPSASMASTSYELLSFLKSTYGGYIAKQKTYQDHHKQSWSWMLVHNKALVFLKSILPFMREESKINRANHLIKNYPVVTKRNGRYNEAQLKQKLEFEKRFFEL